MQWMVFITFFMWCSFYLWTFSLFLFMNLRWSHFKCHAGANSAPLAKYTSVKHVLHCLLISLNIFFCFFFYLKSELFFLAMWLRFSKNNCKYASCLLLSMRVFVYFYAFFFVLREIQLFKSQYFTHFFFFLSKIK